MLKAEIGQFLADHFNIVITIILFSIGLYSTLMWRHLESKFRYIKEQYMDLHQDHDSLAAKIVRLEACQHEMETNYISRFSDIKQDLADNKEEIISTIHSMENRIKDDMFRLHKQSR